ncbi:MAG: transposase [Sulfurovum sp.]|nr:transposase [Sulfurovum sp.]
MTPIIEEVVEQSNKRVGNYTLVAYDWSHLDYKKHTKKQELVTKNKKGNAKQIGYDLQGSLAMDEKGNPLGALAQNLATSEKIYSTYDSNIDTNLTHLEELIQRTKYLRENYKFEKELVDIIDREGDSVALMREYEANGWCYLIRAKSNHKVYLPDEDREVKQGDLAKELTLGSYLKTIKYKVDKKMQKVKIFVNEIEVTIKRDATKSVLDEDGKRKTIFTAGKSIKARFVVERLVDEDNNIVAQWMLLSNVPKEVTATTIGTWYYHRWKIESYFKLLKSSGFNLESWQQETPMALFRRLLVVSYATLFVWKIERSEEKNAPAVRKFLVQLSGRLIEKNKEFTTPALLSGLWVFMKMMNVLKIYDVEALFAFKEQIGDMMGMEL